MILLYNFMDILSTVTEVVLYYVVASCFHITPKNRVRKYLFFVIWGVMVYCLTWFTELGEYKLIVLFFCSVFLLWLIYRVSILKAAITHMFSVVLIVLTESMGSIISSPFAPREGILVGSHMVVHWSIYLVICLCRLGVTIATYYLFKNFLIQFTWKDFIVVLFDYAVVMFIYIFYYSDFFNRDIGYFNIIMEIICLLISLGLLIPFFYFKNYFILRDREQKNQLLIEQMQMQFAYYQDKQKEDERVRGIYHDLKNHLLVLNTQAGSQQETQKLIAGLQEQIAGFENYYHTGNNFLDIIIRDKAKKAQERQIDFSASLQFEAGSFIEPLDISAIFGNALDNAIEACEKLPENMRMITVKASRIHDMLSVAVENTTAADLPAARRTTKKDTFLHGFGLLNIKKAVEKYGGQCTTKTENGLFTLKLIIPIP